MPGEFSPAFYSSIAHAEFDVSFLIESEEMTFCSDIILGPLFFNVNKMISLLRE